VPRPYLPSLTMDRQPKRTKPDSSLQAALPVGFRGPQDTMVVMSFPDTGARRAKLPSSNSWTST
jgi:hypothetical protein